MKKLFAFFGTLFMSLMATGIAMAAEGGAAVGDSKAVAIAISAGVAVGIAAFGAALGQGHRAPTRVVGAAGEHLPRCPGAAPP